MDGLACSGLVGDDAVVIEIPDYGKIQYPQYCFGIAEHVLSFQPHPHPPVAVGMEAAFPLL